MFGFFRKQKKNYAVGDTILFGKYSQKNSENNSPIEWRILDIADNIALLISKYAIIRSGYCNPDEGLEGIVWKNSLARKVCNDNFCNIAFNKSEKNIIHKKIIEQIDISNPAEAVTCEDDVFILSSDDVERYMPDLDARRAYPTDYVKNTSNINQCGTIDDSIPWWLLPQYDIGGTVTDILGNQYPGMIYPKAVNQKGEIHYHGRNAYHSDFAIRPCVQIDLAAYMKLG